MRADDSTTRLLKTGTVTFLMLAVGLLVAPSLSNWHNRQLAERLAARITQVADSEVKIPLRQLAELDESALEQLVAASASERAAVARIARQIINEKMTALTVAAQYVSPAELASSASLVGSALAAHIHQFGPAGKHWAERITLMLIDMADQMPARPARVLLEDCSHVLSAIPPRGPRLRTVAPNADPGLAANATSVTAPEPQLDSLTRVSEGTLDIWSREQPSKSTPAPGRLHQVLPRDLQPTKLPGQLPSSNLSWVPNQRQQRQIASSAPTTTDVSSSLLASEQKGKTKQVIDIPTPEEMEQRVKQLRKLSSEALFLRLPLAGFYEAGLIRTALRERGFDDRELTLRERLNSPDTNQRRTLVDDVSQLPAAAARRLLRLLVEDENADVRFAALTALGTANAPELAEVARELAERDEDQRVAELASRLLKQTRQ